MDTNRKLLSAYLPERIRLSGQTKRKLRPSQFSHVQRPPMPRKEVRQSCRTPFSLIATTRAGGVAPQDAARRGTTGRSHRAGVPACAARTAAPGLAARGANAGGITRDLADDPLRAGLDDDDVVIGRKVLVIAILRFDRDDFRRQP